MYRLCCILLDGEKLFEIYELSSNQGLYHEGLYGANNILNCTWKSTATCAACEAGGGGVTRAYCGMSIATSAASFWTMCNLSAFQG